MVNMGNKDKKKSKKFGRRKIRIRLADPNIPDSYVCEIFDSSLENEEGSVFNDYLKPDVRIKDESSQPKNYFEVLMSKESRKSFNINSARENEEIPEHTKLLRIDESGETVSNRKLKNQKNKEVLIQLLNGKSGKHDIDSSDDESLFEVQRKFKITKSFSKKENCHHDKEELNVLEIQNKEMPKVFDLPKANFASKKKTLNILNYFTKVEGNSKTKEESEDAEEILEVSHKASKLKTLIRKDLEKKLNVTEQKKTLNSINKENVKLAPLFQKKEKKFNDVASQKARLEFLYKTLPRVKNKLEINKTVESPFDFPVISHVQQRSDGVCWSVRPISVSFPVLRSREEYTFKSDKKFRINISQPSPVYDTFISKQVGTTEDYVTDVKCKYSDVNLDSIIGGLKEKWKIFENLAKEMDGKCPSSADDLNLEVLNVLWTEKYKPKSSEILGNRNVVKKLRKWLQSWKTFGEELKSLLKCSRNSKNKEDEESDCFLSSDDENYGLKAPGNVCLLSGPNGCGKTALIHALANELEFSVLELNASSKRTGKKVLSELQEATQSHKVQRVNLLQAQTLRKDWKKKKNKKPKKKKSEEPAMEIRANDWKISLILIEDADIVFEEYDEGFFSAIASLVQTSKRPLIFLTNDVNCVYLDSFKNEHSLVLEMERPNFYKSYTVLDAVASLERGHFQKAILGPLVCRNHFDLRKSLLELQFWTQSDETLRNFSQPFDLGRFWWGLPQFLYCKNEKRFAKQTNRKRKRMNDLFDSSDDEEISTKKLKLNSKDLINSLSGNLETVARKSDSMIRSYSDILDLGSTLDAFRLSNNREPIPGLEYKPKDSLCLDENIEEISWFGTSLAKNISEEMINLSARVFAEKCKERESEERKISFASPSWEEIRWRKFQEEAGKELTVLVPVHNGRDLRSVHLDYLPIMRNICREEKTRSISNPKRKNRFNHYLANLGVELTDENLEINCNVFHR